MPSRQHPQPQHSHRPHRDHQHQQQQRQQHNQPDRQTPQQAPRPSLAPVARQALPPLEDNADRNIGHLLHSAAAYASHAGAATQANGFPRCKADSKHTARHFKAVCETPIHSLYPSAFKRWQAEAEAAGWLLADLSIELRLLVGLSEASLWDSSISLMVPYGAPMLPGSALKGLCRSFARAHQQAVFPSPAPEQYLKHLFGTTDNGGLVTFHDAWWIPGSAPGRPNHPVVPEVVTPHHKPFYDSRGAKPATVFDNPEPVPQIGTHGRFLLALQGPRPWALHALDLLNLALDLEGAGARTPEYGRGTAEARTPASRAAR